MFIFFDLNKPILSSDSGEYNWRRALQQPQEDFTAAPSENERTRPVRNPADRWVAAPSLKRTRKFSSQLQKQHSAPLPSVTGPRRFSSELQKQYTPTPSSKTRTKHKKRPQTPSKNENRKPTRQAKHIAAAPSLDKKQRLTPKSTVKFLSTIPPWNHQRQSRRKPSGKELLHLSATERY
jgi:hypothetical protein